MTNSQQMGDYGMACMYGEALLDFLGSPLPNQPVARNEKEKKAEIVMYYEVLFKTILRKVKVNIDAVRKHFGKDIEIPTIIKQEKVVI